MSTPVSGTDPASRAYAAEIRALHRSTSDPEVIRIGELRALVRLAFGHDLDDPTFARLAEIQAAMRIEQREIAARLMTGHLTPLAFADHMDDAADRAARAFRDVLGDEGYVRLFGDVGAEPGALIDRSLLPGADGSAGERRRGSGPR